MKDRFRFRAWDKEIKAFITDAEFLPFFTIGDINIDDKYVLMQCTGIKDRNGKLIYEYDVVRFGQEDEDIGIIMWNEDECKFVINEEFNKSLSDFSNWYGEDLEILGNIFEHDFFGKDTIDWLKATNIL